MARSRGLSRGNARSRRKTSWDGGPGGTPTGLISSSVSSILGAGAVADEDGMTLVRVRGECSLMLASAASDGDGFIGALGIGIVTSEAFAIGITAMPTPLIDDDWNGWLWHQFFSVRVPVAAGIGSQSSEVRYVVDSKAMRKLRLGDVIFFAQESSEIGVATMHMMADTRVLVKLP